jgi:hypothetical protein
MSLERICAYCWSGFEIPQEIILLKNEGKLEKEKREETRYCPACRAAKKEFGYPQNCPHCGMLAKFGDKSSCLRCEKLILKFKQLLECENCGVCAAFIDDFEKVWMIFLLKIMWLNFFKRRQNYVTNVGRKFYKRRKRGKKKIILQREK